MGSGGGGGGGVLKRWVRVIVFVGFIGFLLVEIVPSGEETTTKTTIRTAPSTEKFKRLDVIPRNAPVLTSHQDPYYMSKRKVPNGPDPIHNRRAGKSKQPPGRV